MRAITIIEDKREKDRDFIVGLDVLGVNEHLFDGIRPVWNGTELVETWTQSDETAEVERQEKKTVKELLDKFESDGNEFYMEIRDLVKYHLTKGTINESQYKGIRVTLEPALRPLRLGDWDIAQDNLLEIERPNGILGQLYDIVKNKIDNYLA